ncbi:MAG: class I SAM-dependent methyltransferase, partial [Acidobacteriota bacterium]|nr:class I SAM-dependent methyltransferase [Acidobacteriota bacterium]
NHVKWHYRNQYAKEESTVEFTMRQYFPQELDYLFASNGFRIEEKYGDFDEQEFTSKSPRQIVVAGKP